MNKTNKPHPQWLADAVLYQIFPPSFQDSNGDGIGDLEGIRRRLDHICELGANTLWLSPIHDSPFRDGGYDVRDYRSIAPRYGTLDDFKRLLDDVHRRGMRLLLDFVPGHTSDEHPWFQASCQNEPNEYSDRYIWTDRTFYLDDFSKVSGQFIRGHGPRCGNYLSNFFYFQPSLNYGFADPDPSQPWQLSEQHPAVQTLRREMTDNMRYWLDLGVDGFRVDMAASLIKANNPAEKKAATHRFWASVREWWDRDYPEALLLAEWSDPAEAVESGFHLDFMIHFGKATGMLPFRGENTLTILPRDQTSYFRRQGDGRIHEFFEDLQENLTRIAGRGFLSIPTGNHDLPRYSIGRDPRDLILINTFLFTLPQVPTIYYGDEIGMAHLGDLPNKEGAFERVGARTPMQWDGSAAAGFSDAAENACYLPLDPAPDRPDVAAQLPQPDSLLNHIRRLIALRREHPALGSTGTLELLTPETQPYPLAYLRHLDGETLLVALNPMDQPATLPLPHIDNASSECIFGQATLKPQGDGSVLELPPFGYAIIKK